SEVAARFILDAMPGKQMAIDADLNAGVIDEKEARNRRERVGHEADFFGAMDGASKFVRGDAIAGIIITVINVVGGFAVGMIDRGWDASSTAEVFTKLTIGDGLTSQIPSFIVAIASALIVTRSGSKAQLGTELADQVTSQPRGLFVTAAFLGLLALTPLPTIPLLGSAVALSLLAFVIQRSQAGAVAAATAAASPAAGRAPEPPAVDSLLKVDTLELEVGFGLVQLVDTSQGGDLLERINAVRRQLAAEIGLVMPPVRIRDNLQLASDEYRIKIRGNPVSVGTSRPGKLLAMDSGLVTGSIDGEPTKEPAFGLNAWWIDPQLRSRAEALNYTVVEPTSVVATHLTETVRRHADELLSRDEVGNLLEQLKLKSPKLVEETIPAIIKPSELQKLLQNLLRERVPVRDIETVLETLSEWAPRTKDLEVLTEYVRNGLRRTICGQYVTPSETGEPRLVCITLDPSMEDFIAGFIDRGPTGTSVTMPARTVSRVTDQLLNGLRRVTDGGHHPVVIASPQVRAVVRQLLEPHLPSVAVLSYNEVIAGVAVESQALVMPPTADSARSPAMAAA
ncbi:MAG: flagellar biosynthesis protein FlhA, partial [bacterium]|nr:flagellar biosynthesis protein FlhA [bacterium]